MDDFYTMKDLLPRRVTICFLYFPDKQLYNMYSNVQKIYNI